MNSLVSRFTLRMRADVPVGCLLSGGLDSSAVLGMAATYDERPVAAFTVGFDHADYDESAGAGEAARHAGADHEVLAITEGELAEHFQDAVWHGEMVQYNSHGTARYLLSRGVRQAGYKSVMVGEGADEVFLGYGFSRAAARASTKRTLAKWVTLAMRLLRSPRRLYPGLAATSPWLARMASLLDLSPALLTRVEGGLGHLRSLCSPDFLREFEGYDIYKAYYRACDNRAGISAWDPARQLTYLWLHSLFVNYHLAADRLGHGAWGRGSPPLPRSRSVRACAATSAFRPGEPRPREASAPRGHQALYPAERLCPGQEAVLGPPTGARRGSPLNELVQDTLRGAGVSAVPFLDSAAVVGVYSTLFQTWRRGEDASVDSLLLLLASICTIQDRFQL